MRRGARGLLSAIGLMSLSMLGAGCGGGAGRASTGTGASGSPGSASSTTRASPQSIVIEDGQYLADVRSLDPELSTYEQQQGYLGLRTLVTDGAAFCLFLRRGHGIDSAMIDVAAGARTDESKTHLPLSVTTFNTIEAVALLTLCPSEQRLVPAAVQSRIRHLGDTLKTSSG